MLVKPNYLNKAILLTLILTANLSSLHAEDGEYMQAWYTTISLPLNESLDDLKKSKKITNEKLKDAQAKLEQYIDAGGDQTRAQYLLLKQTFDNARSEDDKLQNSIDALEAKLKILQDMATSNIELHFAKPIKCMGTINLVSKNGQDVKCDSTIFEAGDVIATGADGFLEFAVSDGSIMHLGAMSQLEIVAFAETDSRYNLSQGKVHGNYYCVKLKDQECRNFSLASGENSLNGSDMEASIDLMDIGVGRFYAHSGTIEFLNHLKEASELTANTFIQIDGGRQFGPMVLNLNWIPSWWQ